MKIVAIASAVMLMISIPIYQVNAQPNQGRNVQSKEKIWSDINLNEQQKRQIDSLHNLLQTTQNQLFNQLHTTQTEIADELLKSAPDSSTLKSYAQKLGEVHTRIADELVNHLLSVKSILNPEQFSKLIKNGLKEINTCRQPGIME